MPTPLPNIGAPARRALEKVNITSLEQLTKIDEKSLLDLHGVGPKAVEQLKEAMGEAKLSMLSEPLHDLRPDFLVLGDLKCDNAPKKRVIRDYLILLFMKDRARLLEMVNEKVTVKQRNASDLEGIDSLLDGTDTEEDAISSLEVLQILTHGKEGAAHGVITFASGKQTHFAEFYLFESHKKDARIKEITRYIME